jgi:hypothetical protein
VYFVRPTVTKLSVSLCVFRAPLHHWLQQTKALLAPFGLVRFKKRRAEGSFLPQKGNSVFIALLRNMYIIAGQLS